MTATEPYTVEEMRRLKREAPIASLEYHDELPSTNDRALRLATEGHVVCPHLILAAQQTAGRGRGLNRWWAAPGALTFSLLVDLQEALPPNRWPLVSLTVGLSVCETLQAWLGDRDLALKWPNDVYLMQRKLCGILIEVPQQSGRVVVGVGVNVNNSFAGAPRELQQRAISLLDAIGTPFDRVDFLIHLLQSIADNLQQLAENPKSLAERWQSYCLLRGRLVHLQVGPRQLTGMCRGIGIDGALLLSDETGMQRCYSGSVERFE